MASNKATHASGAVQGDHDLRRRNVVNSGDSNGRITAARNEVDDKKSRKVKTISTAN